MAGSTSITENMPQAQATRQADRAGITTHEGFRLFRYFVILSVIAATAIMLLVGLGLRGVLQRYVIAGAEQNAIRLTDALRDLEASTVLHESPEGNPLLTISPGQIQKLDQRMRVFLAPFDIVKIKIFDTQTRIIYSTDTQIIGSLDTSNQELLTALSGTVSSKLETKDQAWDLDQESRPDVDLVETYVPVRGTHGKIIGSFEIYKDVTSDFRAATATLVRSEGILAVALIAVFAALSVLMYRAAGTAQRHEASLKASEARTRAIVDTAADGIITFNEKRAILSFNAAAEKIFHITAQNAIGTDFGRLIHLTDDTRRAEAIDRYCRQIHPHSGGRGHEIEGLRGDGTSFPMWLAVSQVNPAGERICAAILRDLTEQKRAEMKLREQDLIRAKEMSVVAQMATAVAHEIRNPLTSVKLFVQNHREEMASRGVLVDDLDIVEQEILRMERSLQTFLDFARPSKPNLHRVDLVDLVDRALILIEGRAFKQGVVCVKIVPPDTPVMVKADPDRIQQVLLNLALNALDMMPKGGTLEINLDTSTDHRAQLRVIDSGPGISPDALPRLFEPFMTTKETGVGLGLVVSRRIAQEHGGSLTAHNRPEGGACFMLLLPMTVGEG